MYNQQLNYNNYYYRKFNDYQVIRVEPINIGMAKQQ